jgi:16S rRNA (uracil1498-N3)-methyltransferase
MKRALSNTLPSDIGMKVLLSEEESHHLTQVLRLPEGSEIELLDGKGSYLKGRLIFEGKKKVWVEALHLPLQDPSKNSLPIVLEMALIKGDPFEWVIEKAVELRVQKLIPILCDHSVVQIDKKGPEAFKQRWQKIADQALKQCGRLERLEIAEPIPVTQLSTQTQRLWFYEKSQGTMSQCVYMLQKIKIHSPIHLLIGPEGGYSKAEITFLSSRDPQWLHPVGLGSVVLRAETAAICAVSLVSAQISD